MILKFKKSKKGDRAAVLLTSVALVATLVVLLPINYEVHAEPNNGYEDEMTSTTVFEESTETTTAETTTEEESKEETTTEETTTTTTETTTITTETATEATTEEIIHEIIVEDVVEDVEEDNVYGEYMGKFEITVYCPCDECNGQWALWDEENDCWYTNTRLGPRARLNHTIAVDPSVIPLGTKVMITGDPEVEGIIFTAEDTGNAVNGNHIDLYINNCHQYEWWDNPYLDVYIVD